MATNNFDIEFMVFSKWNYNNILWNKSLSNGLQEKKSGLNNDEQKP